jgi:hypothetical protein
MMVKVKWRNAGIQSASDGIYRQPYVAKGKPTYSEKNLPRGRFLLSESHVHYRESSPDSLYKSQVSKPLRYSLPYMNTKFYLKFLGENSTWTRGNDIVG